MTGFLDLPGEIRNQIYSHLLILPSPSTPRLLGDPPLHPSILSTNRKIHTEALPILYSNTFLAHPCLLTSMPRLRLYYPSLSSPSLISLITKYHIRFRLDCDPQFDREGVTKAFSGVEELTIEVFQAQFGSSGRGVLGLWEGVRGVKKARIYGSVTLFPAYAKWLERSMATEVDEVVEPLEEDGEMGEEREGHDIWSNST